jgi:hypothetical protein
MKSSSSKHRGSKEAPVASTSFSSAAKAGGVLSSWFSVLILIIIFFVSGVYLGSLFLDHEISSSTTVGKGLPGTNNILVSRESTSHSLLRHEEGSKIVEFPKPAPTTASKSLRTAPVNANSASSIVPSPVAANRRKTAVLARRSLLPLQCLVDLTLMIIVTSQHLINLMIQHYLLQVGFTWILLLLMTVI